VNSPTPKPVDRPENARLLIDIALQFGATLDLDRLLPQVLTRLTDLVRAERALFALFDDNGHPHRAVLHNLAWAGPGHPLPASQTVISEVLEKGEAVMVADAATDSNMSSRQSVQIHGLRFILGVPVHGRGRVVGVIYTDSKVSLTSDITAELETLTALSRLVGTAVENARLFEEQLFRHRLLGKTVHDFRSPLAGMRALTEMIPLLDGVTAEVSEIAAEILVGCDRMDRMMEHALELSSIDHGHRVLRPRPLDLLGDLPKQVRQLTTAARQRGVQVQLELPVDLPNVETVPDQLWIVVDNLLFNAIKHARTGSTVTVSARVRRDAGPADARRRSGSLAAALFEREGHIEPAPYSDFVEVTVRNVGTPIPDALLPRLFADFTPGAERTGGVKSTGLGLSIVDEVVRHLGGLVWATSTTVEGTCFRFTLPTHVEGAIASDRIEPNLTPAQFSRDTAPLPSFGRYAAPALSDEPTLPPAGTYGPGDEER
jgi:signal transduction histidine kinase